MEQVGGEGIGQQSSVRQVAVASFVGTALEWYDYFIYGTAAALVFPALYFPGFSTFAGTLASFATFGVGFFARPLLLSLSASSRRTKRLGYWPRSLSSYCGSYRASP